MSVPGSQLYPLLTDLVHAGARKLFLLSDIQQCWGLSGALQITAVLLPAQKLRHFGENKKSLAGRALAVSPVTTTCSSGLLFGTLLLVLSHHMWR